MPPGARVLILPADPKPRHGDAAVHGVNVHAVLREQGCLGGGGYLARICHQTSGLWSAGGSMRFLVRNSLSVSTELVSATISTSSGSSRMQICRPCLLAGVGPLRKLPRHRSNRLHLQTSAVSPSGSCYWATATEMGMFSPGFAFRSTAPAASTDRSGGYESLSKMQPVVVTAFLPKTTRPGSVSCCRQNRARGSE